MSTEIKSSSSLAAEWATNLANAISALSDSNVAEDERSTIIGNGVAKSLIENQETACQTVIDQMTQMVANIHSLAAEFEARDNELSQTILNKNIE